MVIINRFMSRSSKFLDIYISFLNNLERVIYLSRPGHLLKIRDDFLNKIQQKIGEKIISKIPPVLLDNKSIHQ